MLNLVNEIFCQRSVDWAVRYKIGSFFYYKYVDDDRYDLKSKKVRGSGKGKKSQELPPNDRGLTLTSWPKPLKNG